MASDAASGGACGSCGWSGPLEHGPGAGRGSGPGAALGAGDVEGEGAPSFTDDPRILACPSCGSVVLQEPPSVAEIVAARRTPAP